MKINKLLCSLALASVSIAQLPLTAFANETVPQVTVEEEGQMSFSDVSPNHWAYKAIKSLVEDYGVMGGFPDGTFRGNRNLTRYEAAAMVAKIMEKVEQMAATGEKPVKAAPPANLDALRKEFKSELDSLKSQLNKMSKDAQDMQQDLDETRDMVEEVKGMLPQVKVFGDVSTRFQGVSQEIADPSKYSTFALQTRANIGIKGHMPKDMSWVNFGARLTTSAADDLTNRYVSLGNMLNKSGISLDQMYVSLRPWDGGLDLTLGKHALPFVRSTELVWDEDLTLDGAYLKLRFGEMHNHLALYGSYSMLSLGGINPASQFGGNYFSADTAGIASGGGNLMLSNDTIMFKLGGNYHKYMNPNKVAGKFKTQATNDMAGAEFVSDFDLATGTVALSLFPNAAAPLTLHGDVSYNLGAGMRGTDEQKANAKKNNLGMVAGLSLGKLREAGNLMLGVNYKMVGQESVFAPFNEDQLGGSNVTAYEGKAGWQMSDKASLVLSGQMATPSNAAAGAKPNYTLRGTLTHRF